MTRSGQETDQSVCPDPANVAWISRCGMGSERNLTNQQINRYHRWGGEALTKRVSLVDGNDSKKKKRKKDKYALDSFLRQRFSFIQLHLSTSLHILRLTSLSSPHFTSPSLHLHLTFISPHFNTLFASFLTASLVTLQ